jgi:predicted metal-dependent phosphoesterase TrpH
VLIDFHTHSTASDGEWSPARLVEEARAAGIAMLALTDHDTVAGHRQASALVSPGDSLQLVPGVELSCHWSSTTIHILGLGMDCDHPAMREALAFLDDARLQRAQKIAQRLGKLGFEGALEGAQAFAGDSQLGRPHFAAWLVANNHVADHTAAFDRYLGQGKPGDVKTFWPAMADVVDAIERAGGAAVIAHPLKYRFTGMKLRRLITDFVAAGGSAIEIASGRQSTDQLAHLQRLAREFSLEVSMGSDFHRPTQYSAPLGVTVPAPDTGLVGVWQRWQGGAPV